MNRLLTLSSAAVTLVAGAVLAAPSASAATTLPNGFTAKVVAHSGQVIHGTIDATGYDLGVYIGPGVHDVEVVHATISGARDQGILVQDTSDVAIRDSTVKGNALAHLPQLTEVKGITLAGTHEVLVAGNTVVGNGDGGIGVYDDGPNSPQTFAPTAIDSSGVLSTHNVVWGNTIKDNLNGCGIVVSAKNPGGGVRDNSIGFNTVTGFDPATGDRTPALGGIVVAGGSFGAVVVSDTALVHNTITGGFIPGISLHAQAPASMTGTLVIDDVMARNGGSTKSTGVEIAGSPGTIADTQVLLDHVTDDYYGVFHVGDSDTRIFGLSTTRVTQPVAP